MTDVEPEVEPLRVSITSDDVEEDGFMTIWNIASASCDSDTARTRQLASKLLLFLCKKKCDFIVTSTANAEYLDNWFERDTAVLYNWKPDSEFVDVVAQHAEVPAKAFLAFLKNEKFDSGVNHNATRAARVEWFQNMWSVG
ncbi:hypothetical protein FF011L_20400 [Roseimaritima multifibrata]|uniref:Uncharacterized protein n=1 Tax=Roseimaritima multifibrata TaxID=1930274 RepID=A0A517MEH0_9BACT|nr:hypothetical protein [Roseimaritima multifibrata]QDS93278.1 hypothetical protein FF011L_20400 [Roseimaritima multifibrata]